MATIERLSGESNGSPCAALFWRNEPDLARVLGFFRRGDSRLNQSCATPLVPLLATSQQWWALRRAPQWERLSGVPEWERPRTGNHPWQITLLGKASSGTLPRIFGCGAIRVI